jgi:putative intracellular protease/amidase
VEVKMKKRSRIGLAVLAMLGIAAMAFGQDKPKVLLIAQEISVDINFMIQNEIRPMQDLLKQAGYDVDIATETGRELGYGSSAILPNMKLDQVRISDYKGLLIPCMAVLEPKSTMPKAAIAIALSAFQKGMPIAAQVSGVTILGQAKILEGKNYATEQRYTYLVPGGIYQGSGIVQDGNIITSGTCPFLAKEGRGKDGTADLIKGFIRLLQQ